jgi:hypothetical protein
VLVGGGSANPGLVRAFREVLALGEADVIVPADRTTLGARGAALAASVEETVSLEDLLFAIQRGGRLGATPPCPPLRQGRERALQALAGDVTSPAQGRPGGVAPRPPPRPHDA